MFVIGWEFLGEHIYDLKLGDTGWILRMGCGYGGNHILYLLKTEEKMNITAWLRINVLRGIDLPEKLLRKRKCIGQKS